MLKIFYLLDLEIIIVANIANNNITLKIIKKIAPYVYRLYPNVSICVKSVILVSERDKL